MNGMGEMSDKAPDGGNGNTSGSTSTSHYRLPTGANLNIGQRATIEAMHSLGIPKTKIAEEVGVSRTTVLGTLRNADHTDPRIVERVKKEMASHFWMTGNRALNGITEEKVAASSALQLATVAAISTDKALLLDGKPTVRIEFQGQADQALGEQIERMQAELDGWKDGTTINAPDAVVGDLVAPESVSPTE